MRGGATVVGVAILSAVAASRGIAQETPTQVATAFFKAMADERWLDAARRLDLAAFDRYRQEQVTALRHTVRDRDMTVEQILFHNPDMPRAVAEYQIRQIQEHRELYGDGVSMQFADVANADSLAAMSLEDAAARWLQAMDHRWELRRLLKAQRARGCRVPDDAEKFIPRPTPPTIIGAIVSGSAAYVVYRNRDLAEHAPGSTYELSENEPRTMELRATSIGWRIRPRSALAGDVAIGVMSTDDCPPRGRRPPSR
jgi:hypothetical protein